MRTTVTIPDDLLQQAKRRAVDTGRTLSEVVEEALRIELVHRPAAQPPFRLQLITSGGGGVRPGVDISNNAAVRDIMDGPV